MLYKKQREFFYHALHIIKTSDKPFYAFLSGSGGVGKSHLIKSIYQAALKYYNARAGDDFRRVHILLLAPTGKAANLIKGNTIHSALAIPASQSPTSYPGIYLRSRCPPAAKEPWSRLVTCFPKYGK